MWSEAFFIWLSSFLLKPVVPIIIGIFNSTAVLSILIVDSGREKSIIRSAVLIESDALKFLSFSNNEKTSVPIFPVAPLIKTAFISSQVCLRLF